MQFEIKVKTNDGYSVVIWASQGTEVEVVT